MKHSPAPQPSPNWRRTLFERKFHIPGTSFIHMFFTWRFWRRAVIGLAVLATLIGLVWTEENIRGKLAWERYEKELRAAGEPTRLEDIIPPPVPDDQNFAMAPYWKPMLVTFEGQPEGITAEEWATAYHTNSISLGADGYYDMPSTSLHQGNRKTDLDAWQRYFRQTPNTGKAKFIFPTTDDPQSPQEDIRLALSVYDDAISNLSDAANRPRSRFPVRYQKNYQALLPHASRLKSIVQTISLLGAVDLSDRDSEAAFENLLVCMKVRDSIASEPLLISFLVRAAINHYCAGLVWEGMLNHQWSREQLKDIENLFTTDNWFDHYTRGIHGEMVMGLEFCRLVISGEERLAHIMPNTEPWMKTATNLIPDGFIYQNMVWMARYHHELSLRKADVNAKAFLDLSQNEERFLGELDQIRPYTFMARQLVPAVSSVVERAARAQAVSHLVVTACQLERHFLDRGEYPESLDVLVPDRAPKVLIDPYDGQPLRYIRLAPASYKLYSVHKNIDDDGGAMRTKPDGQGRFAQLDLTWPIGIPQETDVENSQPR